MVARQGNTRSGRGNSGSAAAAAAAAVLRGPKNLGWMGARPRLGRWASELRLKCTRERLWIGTFPTPEQAALAYDAAIYCIYGTDIPRTRRFNFPNMPRPNVSDEARAAGLTKANIRAIAYNYARRFAVYVTPSPPPVLLLAAATPAPPPALVVEPAAAAVAVDAAAAAVGGGGHGAGAVAPRAGPGNMNFETVEELFNSFSPEEVDALMASMNII